MQPQVNRVPPAAPHPSASEITPAANPAPPAAAGPVQSGAPQSIGKASRPKAARNNSPAANFETTFASISLPPTALPPRPRRELNAALNIIYGTFGENAVLVPVPASQAIAMAVDYPAKTLDQPRKDSDQDRLTRENIAVACINGLFAIFFPTDPGREDFLAANPALRDSFSTSAPVGTILWLRCPDGLPVNLSLPGVLCWLGAGAAVVVLGRGDWARAYKIQKVAKPVEVRFDTIIWPEAARPEFILHQVRHKHGNPAIMDPRNRLIPSWDFWARCFALIHRVGYDIPRASFVQRPPRDEIRLLANDQVLGLISEFLSSYGRQPRFALLLQYCQPHSLKEFLTVLRIVTAQSCEAEDKLETFLKATVEACPGADISSAELNAAQLQYFLKMNLPPYPKSVFEKRVPDYLERMFHVVHSRKIWRNESYCRGYTHVRLKRQGGG